MWGSGLCISIQSDIEQGGIKSNPCAFRLWQKPSAAFACKFKKCAFNVTVKKELFDGLRYGKWVEDTLLDARVKVDLFDPIRLLWWNEALSVTCTPVPRQEEVVISSPWRLRLRARSQNDYFIQIHTRLLDRAFCECQRQQSVNGVAPTARDQSIHYLWPDFQWWLRILLRLGMLCTLESGLRCWYARRCCLYGPRNPNISEYRVLYQLSKLLLGGY